MDNEYKSDETSNWLDDELRDIIGEELEMEIDDERISNELCQLFDKKHKSSLNRRIYFPELLRLQTELVKLLD